MSALSNLVRGHKRKRSRTGACEKFVAEGMAVGADELKDVEESVVIDVVLLE